MVRRDREFVTSMVAGMRLIRITGAGGKVRYAVTTLRNDDRREFERWKDARAAFGAEVDASRADPVVGRYVS